jgi:hypothetical protein
MDWAESQIETARSTVVGSRTKPLRGRSGEIVGLE